MDPLADVTAGTGYRPCVAAIIEGSGGRVFIGERVNRPGSWQFPQGGLELGESHLVGLQRELEEEVSLTPEQYVVGDNRGPYRYLFPPGWTKRGYGGQEQRYFRVTMIAPEAAVNVCTPHPEFRAGRWIEPAEFSLAWLPPMKHGVYRQVFADFFGVQLA